MYTRLQVGKEWVPSFAETLKMCVPTSKIETTKLTLKSRRAEDGMEVETEWSLVEIPGRKSLRAAHLHDSSLLEGCEAIIYVAGLTGYYEVSPEVVDSKSGKDSKDGGGSYAASQKLTRLQDSLEYFRNIVSSPVLKETPVYLVLNKVDLFEQTLRSIPLKGALPEFKGSSVDVPQNMVFLSNQYWNCLTSPLHKEQWEYWSTCSFVLRDIKWVFTGTADTPSLPPLDCFFVFKTFRQLLFLSSSL